MVSLGSKTNKDGSITVTQVADVKSTTNNKDGTSTIHGATVTTSTTFDSKGKPTASTESQSGELTETMSKPNGQGSTLSLSFPSRTDTHPVSNEAAFGVMNRDLAEFYRGEQEEQNFFELVSRQRDAVEGPNNIQDAGEIIKAVAEQFKELQEPK